VISVGLSFCLTILTDELLTVDGGHFIDEHCLENHEQEDDHYGEADGPESDRMLWSNLRRGTLTSRLAVVFTSPSGATSSKAVGIM